MPLWAISAADRSQPFVYLHNVMLQLPVTDFIALLQPARLLAGGWAGCAAAAAGGGGGANGTSDKPTVVGLSMPAVLAGVTAFELSPGTPPSLAMIHFAAYSGKCRARTWGVLMGHEALWHGADV